MKKLFVLFLVLLASNVFAADVNALTSAANAGDVNAQLELGLAYLNGDGVDMDLPKAADLLEKAARQGNSTAQYELGTLIFFGGDGVAQDKVKACGWLYTSALDTDLENPEYLCLLQLTEAQKLEARALSADIVKSIKK
jgi:TPR repeat protein